MKSLFEMKVIYIPLLLFHYENNRNANKNTVQGHSAVLIATLFLVNLKFNQI